MGPIGKGFDGAEGVIEGRMVHGTSMLTIITIVKIESHAVCFLDLCQSNFLGQNSTILEETDVLPSELYYTGL